MHSGHSVYGVGFPSPLGHNAELSTRITRLHRQVPADRGPGWDPGLLPQQVVVSPHGESFQGSLVGAGCCALVGASFGLWFSRIPS